MHYGRSLFQLSIKNLRKAFLPVTDEAFTASKGYEVFLYQRLHPDKPNYVRNRGMEGTIYLCYIIDHYDDFPDFAIFVQLTIRDGRMYSSRCHHLFRLEFYLFYAFTHGVVSLLTKNFFKQMFLTI
jgi:hypothetical protein